MNEQATNTADLIPLALIAVETRNTIDWTAHRFGESVVLDDVGMRAIPAREARAFFTERAERKAREIEDRQRRIEEARKRETVLVGVPGKEGASPVEAMISQDPAFSTPTDDFGPGYGSPTRELLDAELAEGRRRTAERRAEAAEKKLLADKMREDLQ